MIAKGVAVVSNGDPNIYIGTNQVSNNNQDPIIASFTNGVRDWVMTEIETTGADSRGVALLWDGDNDLYAAFTTDGTQGSVEQDFRRFTTEGWLSSYGHGGANTFSKQKKGRSPLIKLDARIFFSAAHA